MTPTQTTTSARVAATAATTPAAGTRWTDGHGRPIDDRVAGLAHDVRHQLTRRRALGLFGSLEAADLVRLAPDRQRPTPTPVMPDSSLPQQRLAG